MSAAPVINNDFPANVRAAINAALVACFDAAVHQANAYTAGGTATAFTLTPTPALAANANNVRYSVNFGLAAGTNPTLSVSGQPALPLMMYGSAGALIPATWTGSLITDVQCDGTHWIVLDPPFPAAISAATAALTGALTATGATLSGALNAASAAITGTVSAATFSGSGSGLTGTANSLTAGAANSVAWGNVSGRPTDLGSFTNGPGYATAASMFSSFNSLSPTSGTTYTNSTGKPMLVMVNVSYGSSTTLYTSYLYVNSTVVAQGITLPSNSGAFAMVAMVPPGGTWSVTKGGSGGGLSGYGVY